MTYRAPGETADRLWPLSHLPLLIDEADWQQLTAGIVQRAQLLELVLSDLYGEGRLVAEGAIPAAAIAGSTEYLRSVCGIKPPGGRYLNLYAADVGRGPDGRWWVLGDRTQAPSGAGYALENRLVLSRAFTTLYKSMNVERVAPFFEAFRDALRASADRDEPRIGLLTPGAFSETYFEHATLARYLGFLLVEGDDLAVSGDRIHIRTVAGLKRLDVLLRRVDSNFLDPLELDASSQLGVPGLIDVLRKNGVVVANMPGSGVMEARALLGFLPSLSRRFPRRRSEDAAYRDLVVRPESRARGSAVAARRGCHRGRLRQRRSRLSGQRAGARRRVVVERARTAQDGDQRSRHRLCRPGTGAAVDDAGVGPGPDHAAPVCAAGFRGRNAQWLDHHARRLLPDRRAARRPRGVDGRWRAGGGCLGGFRQGGFGGDAAAGGRYGADQAHRRLGAEPRRRQSVLARPLSRARRGDAAAGAGARDRSAIPARARQPCCIRSSESSGFW